MLAIRTYLICILIGYLLGSSNMAYYLGKIRKVNLREGGSENLGTSNAVVLLGKKAGILVFFHDALKGTLAMLLCGYLFPETPHVMVVAGVAAVFGHIFPFYLKFQGGKGFATYLGVILALDWRFTIAMAIIIILVSFLFDWIVAGTFATIALSPAYLAFIGNRIGSLILLVGSVCIFLKHIKNIRKKIQRQEIGVRQALFKK